MKKTILIVALVVLALGALGVGVAFAQGGQPPFAPGMMGYGYGPMQAYVVTAFADKLDLSADEVNTRLANGETLYQIALAEGIAEDEIASFLTDVHTTAFDKAVADGVITREQADWMLQNMQSRFENGYGPGNCPRYNGLNGQDGRGYGPGRMGGGRWQSQ